MTATRLVFGHSAVADYLATHLQHARIVRCSDPSTVEDDIDETVGTELKVNGAIIVISETPQCEFDKLSATDWSETFRSGLKIPFVIARTMVEEFLGEGNGGRIVCVAPDALRGRAFDARNAACANALRGFTRTFAKEYGRRGITANMVTYDPQKTDHTSAVLPAVEFLLSEEAAFISGDILRVGE